MGGPGGVAALSFCGRFVPPLALVPPSQCPPKLRGRMCRVVCGRHHWIAQSVPILNLRLLWPSELLECADRLCERLTRTVI